MDTLDSRSLSYTDCFLQRFSKAGEYRYSLQSGGPHPEAQEASFVIVVTDGERAPRAPHAVTVRWENRSLVADPPRLEIATGESVMWHAQGASTPRYSVRGASDEVRFGSAALGAESVYSHAFGLAGEYLWVDALGSGIAGVVVVKSPPVGKDPQDQSAWMNALKKGTLIDIDGEVASPRSVEVYLGQTVFWAVRVAPACGLTITDRQLLGGRRAPDSK